METLTVRLVTLRRLLHRASPPISFECATPIGVVALALAQTPGAIAVFVDAHDVLCGTLAAGDLPHADRGARADAIMSTRWIVMEPEDEADQALATLDRHGIDRLLVATRDGRLLGALERDDLVRALERR